MAQNANVTTPNIDAAADRPATTPLGDASSAALGNATPGPLGACVVPVASENMIALTITENMAMRPNHPSKNRGRTMRTISLRITRIIAQPPFSD
jgi:hypothetical protein